MRLGKQRKLAAHPQADKLFMSKQSCAAGTVENGRRRSLLLAVNVESANKDLNRPSESQSTLGLWDMMMSYPATSELARLCTSPRCFIIWRTEPGSDVSTNESALAMGSKPQAHHASLGLRAAAIPLCSPPLVCYALFCHAMPPKVSREVKPWAGGLIQVAPHNNLSGAPLKERHSESRDPIQLVPQNSRAVLLPSTLR